MLLRIDSEIRSSIAIKETVSPVATSKFSALGKTLATHRHREWTAWVKATAAGRSNQAWNLATRRQSCFTLSIWPQAIRVWGCGNQQLGVRMLGPLNYFLAGPSLNRLSGIHDERILGKIACACNVMGNEEQRQLFLVFKTQHQVEYIQANRDIQHRNRLIGQQHLRLRC